MDRPKILFVTYGGGHVTMVIPVVEHLIENELAEPIVMALTIAGAACRKAEIPFVGFKDFVDDDSESIAVGRQLTAGSPGHPDVDPDETIAYHGASYMDLVGQLGPQAAAERFTTMGRAAFRPVAFFEQVIDQIQPDVVVATSSPRSERASIEAAMNVGVPSCCILDVFGVQEEWVMEPGFADRVCVINDAVRDTALSKGRRRDEVIVTGNPAFDELVEVRERRAGSTARAAGFRVLWASHPEPVRHPTDPTREGNHELPNRVAAELAACAASHPDWDIIVRPHPTESDLEVPGPSNIRVDCGERLTEQLIWADVVVTVASTVGLQAALAGIPVVSVLGSVISADVPLADFGLARGVEVDRLGDLLEIVSSEPPEGSDDEGIVGDATRNVVDVIMSLAHTGETDGESEGR